MAFLSYRGFNYTEREVTFVNEYLVDFNKTRAAIAAGYSKNTACARACNMLKMPKIKALMTKLREDDKKDITIRKAEVLEKVRQSLQRDLHQLADLNGVVFANLRDLPREAFAYVDGLKPKQLYINKDIDCKALRDALERDLDTVYNGNKRTSEEAYKRLKLFLVRGVKAQSIELRLSPNAAVQDIAMRHTGAYAPEKNENTTKLQLDWDGLHQRAERPSNVIEIPQIKEETKEDASL